MVNAKIPDPANNLPNMIATLIQMFVLIACGAVWRWQKPAGLHAEQTRQVLTTVVYYLFLPAMVLEVLWQAEIGLHSLQYTFLGVSSVFFSMFCIWLLGVVLKFDKPKMGALILATSFANVTYLGLPVLEQVFGKWARSVAIQLDLFATGPLLFTVGIMLARYYGKDGSPGHKTIFTYLNAPPFWAAFVAVMLNLNHVPQPQWLLGVLQILSNAVVPLMLFSLGLALSWRGVSIKHIPYIAPVLLIKMWLMPLFALWLTGYLTLEADNKAAAVLEMAMPCMVLGIVFCDRYKLDSSLYAMAVTISTALSIVVLPLWYEVLQ